MALDHIQERDLQDLRHEYSAPDENSQGKIVEETMMTQSPISYP